jgi:outer membrane biosynthesis protein TonB
VASRNDNAADAQSFIKSLETNDQNKSPNFVDVGPKLVRGGVVNGKATLLAKPAYPVEARSSRASGAVNVQVTINEQGKVIFACAMSGNALLYEASENAAYQSTFSPTTLAGKTVKVMGVIVYNFVP